MATLAPEVRSKLGKALAMLSSTEPGERRAAFAAVERILTAAGLGWRDVAELVKEPAAAASAVPASAPPPSSTPDLHLYQRPDGRMEIPEPEMSSLLDIIRARANPTPWEDQFLAGFEERCGKWPGRQIWLSEKQLVIFTRLVERI